MADADRAGRRAANRATIEPFGDAAILVTIGSRVDPRLARRAGVIAAAVDELRTAIPAIGRPVAAHASVLVPFDPLAIGLEEVVAAARASVDAAEAGVLRPAVEPVAPLEIGVRYGGADGPDLDDVAARLGLRPADVIEIHAGARYEVLFLGFAPGFAYLAGLPRAIAVPRRASPRERVPAGSVAIAGEQTAVYPLAMPGGWQLIGRTDAVLFDASAAQPATLEPGAIVRFVPAPRG